MTLKKRTDEMISYIMLSDAGFTKRAFNMPIVLDMLLLSFCFIGFFMDIPEKQIIYIKVGSCFIILLIMTFIFKIVYASGKKNKLIKLVPYFFEQLLWIGIIFVLTIPFKNHIETFLKILCFAVLYLFFTYGYQLFIVERYRGISFKDMNSRLFYPFYPLIVASIIIMFFNLTAHTILFGAILLIIALWGYFMYTFKQADFDDLEQPFGIHSSVKKKERYDDSLIDLLKKEE